MSATVSTAPLVCPDCGGAVETVRDGMIGDRVHPGYHVNGRELPIVWRLALFAACTQCEFCIEIRKGKPS